VVAMSTNEQTIDDANFSCSSQCPLRQCPRARVPGFSNDVITVHYSYFLKVWIFWAKDKSGEGRSPKK